MFKCPIQNGTIEFMVRVKKQANLPTITSLNMSVVKPFSMSLIVEIKFYLLFPSMEEFYFKEERQNAFILYQTKQKE
jgi:hypothetical protein